MKPYSKGHDYWFLGMSILNNPYKGDYDHTPEVDKRGRFRDRFFYTGDLYVLPFDENEKKKTYLPCILYGIGMLCALILQGMINQSSSRTLWVVLPYFIQFLPALYYMLGIMEYVGAAPRMTRAQYDKGIARMHFCAVAIIVLAVISAGCDVTYLIIRRGEYETGKEILYLSMHLLTAGVAILFGRYYNRHFSGINIEKNK